MDSDSAKKLLDDEFSHVICIREKTHIHMPPIYATDLKKGANELLEKRKRKYDKSLGGIILAFGNVKFIDNFGSIVLDHTFVSWNIEVDFYVFRPTVGSVLRAKINKMSKGHIGCLVHDCFNMSLPNSSISSFQVEQEIICEITNLDLTRQIIKLSGVYNDKCHELTRANCIGNNSITRFKYEEEENESSAETNEIKEENVVGNASDRLDANSVDLQDFQEIKVKKELIDDLSSESGVILDDSEYCASNMSEEHTTKLKHMKKKKKKSSRKSSENLFDPETSIITKDEKNSFTKIKSNKKSKKVDVKVESYDSEYCASNMSEEHATKLKHMKKKKKKSSRKSSENLFDPETNIITNDETKIKSNKKSKKVDVKVESYDLNIENIKEECNVEFDLSDIEQNEKSELNKKSKSILNSDKELDPVIDNEHDEIKSSKRKKKKSSDREMKKRKLK